MINTDSANIIYDNVESDDKEIKWYEESGHVITFDKEKEQLHEDVYNFLEKLDWTVYEFDDQEGLSWTKILKGMWISSFPI